MSNVTVNDTFGSPVWTSVSFIDAFDVPPVIVVLATTQGSDPSALRVRNVTTTGFEVVAVEPSANDGPHVAMDAAYLAVEPGAHQFADGTRIVAQTHTTTSFVSRAIGSTWDTVNYVASLNSAPAVVASINTANNETGAPPGSSSVPFLAVAMQSTTSPSTLQLALERAESTAGSVTFAETIGLVAIDGGISTTFMDRMGASITLQALRTAANIRGYNDGCFTNNWSSAFTAPPVAVASQITRFGNNGGWLRRCSLSAFTIGLTVDEDTDSDSERSHTGEAAALIAASANFHASFDAELLLTKSVRTASDPQNGASNPFSIPGAVMEYSIEGSNLGNMSPDSDSIVVVDAVPAELSMCVAPSCLFGGPVIFDDSASPVPSGLSLGSITYSNDGGMTYTYIPMPDLEGFDAAVDAVRIELDGDFAPDRGGRAADVRSALGGPDPLTR